MNQVLENSLQEQRLHLTHVDINSTTPEAEQESRLNGIRVLT